MLFLSLKQISISQVISYTGGQKLHYGDPGLSKRMDFTGDPALGDASVSISAVKASDTATYQCKVKKAPGVDMRKVTLVVMGEECRPSQTGFCFTSFIIPLSSVFKSALSLKRNLNTLVLLLFLSIYKFCCSGNALRRNPHIYTKEMVFTCIVYLLYTLFMKLFS